MNIDLTAAARRADPEQARAWLADQRVFISSAIADTVDERRAVAEIVEDEGARPVLFEELGRDRKARIGANGRVPSGSGCSDRLPRSPHRLAVPRAHRRQLLIGSARPRWLLRHGDQGRTFTLRTSPASG
jgi:Domain of unknown function (DUF4062)